MRLDLLYKYLYNKSILAFASFLASKARLDVLRVLMRQTAPLPLRHIALLSDSPLFSVQRALAQLAKEKILIRRKTRRYVLFSMNERHPLHPFLRQLVDLETKCRLALSAEGYRQKAQRVLDFSNNALELLKGVRRDRRVSKKRKP